MDRASEIKRLVADDRSVGDIAATLGISRQAVHQFAAKNNINLGRVLWNRTDNAKEAKPVPRVITGGVEVDLTTTTTGTISELLVAADLLARGWRVYMPIQISKGHDIIACRGNDIITVEVRSGKRNRNGVLFYGKKASDKSMIYGVVVTGEPVSYLPPLP